MELISNITGVILAGGKSSRMKRDKALLKFHDKPFIQLISETLHKVFENVIIISDHVEQYKFLYLPIYQDVYKDCGPLAGIHSAFVHTQSNGIFISSVDLPLIDVSAIQYILNQKCNADAILFSLDGQIQPLFGLYYRACLLKIENQLKQKRYSVVEFLDKINTNIILLNSKQINISSKILQNINSPEDYQSLLKK